ncbi:Transcription factor MYB56 [Hirschfeldia incana]|nr:Transcription factor MYB56 [Hirschfeldia incana]
MNPKLIEKVLTGNKTIKLSRRFEEANNFGSPPNSHNNFSLARNPLHSKSYPLLERVENENSLKRRGNNGMKTKLCLRGHWRPTEDAKLKELVAQFGPQNWNLIAHHLLGRSDPRINKKAFTEEEESRLLTAHRAYGNKWSLIARLFPGRTDNAVKNHWHVVMARRTRASQRQQPLHAPSVNAEMTFSSSCRYSNGRVAGGILVNEADDDDGSAVSTCTTELSLTPPSSTQQPRFLHDDNTLASGKDGQCVQRAELNGIYSKKMDHQNHLTITVGERTVEMRSGLHFFDFLGVGAS